MAQSQWRGGKICEDSKEMCQSCEDGRKAFLRNYRTTPHTTTGVAPSVLLMKRAVCSKIPQTENTDPISEVIHKHDLLPKAKIKAYADSKCYVKPCNITPGDTVLVKRHLQRVKKCQSIILVP